MTLQSQDGPRIAPGVIQEQLDAVLTKASFKGSERSSKLLRFLVEQTLAGQADQLKEYTVGAEALGKGSSFDPRMDPSVRSEVSRLRTRPEKYYASEGAADSITIVLPKGSYVPRFEQRSVVDAGEDARVGLRWTRSRALAALGATLVLALAVFAYHEIMPSSPALGIASERATASSPANAISVAVLPFLNLSGDPNQEFFSDGVTEEITATLAKIPDLRVVARTSAF